MGFSLPLQEMALRQRGEMRQRSFLLSDAVQEFLEEAAEALLLNSLHAERAGATVKRYEVRQLSLLSNVSRDLLHKQFVVWREAQAGEMERCAARVRKLRTSRWQAIAWELDQSRPIGRRISQENRSILLEPAKGGYTEIIADGCPGAKDVGVVSQPLPGPETAACSVSTRTPIKRRSAVSPGASGSKLRKRRPVQDAATGQFSPGGLATGGRPACELEGGLATGGRPACEPASSGFMLTKEQCKAELSRRRAGAKLEMNKLRAQALFPVTRFQWAEWLGEHLTELRRRMQTGEAPLRRRQFNARVV